MNLYFKEVASLVQILYLMSNVNSLLLSLVVVVPASMQKFPHLNLQLQVVMVPVQIEILLGFVSNVLVQCTLYILHPIFLHVFFSAVWMLPEGQLPGHKALPNRARHPNWVAVLLFLHC